jgi:peptidoglycan hydrolase-like protein with peptidoglycan-binding domain
VKRKYVSIDHYHAPFRGAVLQGLGGDRHDSTPPVPTLPGRSRVYYELSQFRSPYRHGYYQDNTLMGIGDASTDAMAALQSALGVKASGSLDGPTQAAIRSAQAKNNLPVTGVPDSALLAALGILKPDALPPSGSTWRRDLGTALSQVPQWGYGVLAAAFFTAAYLSYKRFKKSRGQPSA